MTVGTGGIAMGPMGSMREEEDELPLDLDDDGDEFGGDDLDMDLDGPDDEPVGDLGEEGGLGLGEGGEDAIEVSCPSCGDAITVRLVPEVEAGDGLDMGDDMGEDGLDMDGDDLDMGGEEGPPEEDFAGPDELGECMESVNPSVIARLLTDDPDIFTK